MTAARRRQSVSWFKREAAIITVLFVMPWLLVLLSSLFGPLIFRLLR